ncbi:MAG: hypothetical protein JW940_23165 [Polyangiaceae bacterium]|nr:hypothetical protein [Polyangiaceae bacterium]
MTDQDDSPLGPEVHALARSLLDSAASDAPAPQLHRTVAGALGLSGVAAASLAHGTHLAQSAATAASASATASSLGSGASTATTAAGGAQLGTAAAALGGSLKLAPVIAIGKWVAGGFVVASVAVGAAHVAQHMVAPPPGTTLGRGASSPSLSGGPADRAASSGKAERGTPEAQGLGQAEPAGAAVDPALSRDSVRRTPTAAPAAAENPERAPGTQVTRAFGDAQDEPPPLPSTEPSAAAPPLGLGSFPPTGQTRSETVRPNDQLAGEVRLLDSARANIASGRLGPALAALNQYHSGYPSGVLRAEALALTVDAWLRAGNEARARRWVQALERAFPTSQHLERFARLRTGAKAGGGTRP